MGAQAPIFFVGERRRIFNRVHGPMFFREHWRVFIQGEHWQIFFQGEHWQVFI